MTDSKGEAAFLVIDVQNDFLPGGSLAVHEGDQIIPLINRLMDHFETVVFSQDYHPANHGSFASNLGVEPFTKAELMGLEQVAWPDHCVEGTKGVEFAEGLNKKAAKVFKKGRDRNVDSYGAFCDNTKDGKIDPSKMTQLDKYLKSKNIKRLYLAGLATDYCVKHTALQARELGYETFLITDAVKGIAEETIDAAMQEMKAQGVQFISSEEVMKI